VSKKSKRPGNPLRPPPVLYKYRSLARDGKEREYTAKILTANELYFASPGDWSAFPEDLKDKLDGRPEASYRARPSQKIRFHTDVLVSKGWRREVAHKAVTELVHNDQAALARLEQEAAERVRTWVPANVRVLCFSEVKSNRKMWEKYADSHRGICIGFQTEGAPEYEKFFQNAYRVGYTDRKRPVNYYREPTGEVNARRAFFEKGSEWAYEKEWRMVETRARPVGTEIFPKGMISCVILGAAISSEDEAQVRQWVARHPGPPAIQRVRFEPATGRLLICPG